MRKNSKSLPVNTMASQFNSGISIGRAAIQHSQTFEVAAHSHRDDYHLFFIQEKGSTPVEIDFQKYQIQQLEVIYVHPDQVHQIGPFENITASFLAINNENLNSEYLNLLKDIAPAKPLLLNKETFALISKAVLLSIDLSERHSEKLYYSLLKNSCNTLVALIASQYLEQSKSTDMLSRLEVITKAFKASLNINFIKSKKPAEYAQILNISTAYLNECVKDTTGHSVSYHIQQRVILEGKRMLYYTNKSVKEIAADLGYEDYPYFSRLFTKITGMTALTFRAGNRD